MRELILARVTHESDGVATVALVDYDAYTVAIKKVRFSGNFDRCPEFSEALRTGKMRVYREKLDSKKDVWLAHDPIRGCLVLRDSETVLVIPCDEYVPMVKSYGVEGRFYHSDTQASFNPVRLGAAAMVESFWSTAESIMENRGLPLSDEGVRKELSTLTGVGVEYSTGHSWGNESLRENYVFRLYGLNIDKIVMDSDSASINVTVYDGQCGSVEARGMASFRLYGEGGSVSEVILGSDVQEFITSSEMTPILRAESPKNRLVDIEGYSRTDADLTGFPNLKGFKGCWNFGEKSSALKKTTPISIVLPGVDGTTFESCFTSVELQKLSPYILEDGTLDITGIKNIKSSFIGFGGLSSIVGRATTIDCSFASMLFDGTFDIDADVCSVSFGYAIKHNVSRYVSNDKSVHSTHPSGVVRLHVQQQYSDNTQKQIPVTPVMSIGDSGYQTKWEPWEQKIIVDYTGIGHIGGLTIYGRPEINIEVLSAIRELTVRGDKSTPHPVLTGGVATLKSGRYPYKGVRHLGVKSLSGVGFEGVRVCELEEDVIQTIGDRAFYQAKNIQYLVIPRSCYEIGTAAFSECVDGKGDLTTICVYRDSWAHKEWSKGKKLKIKVIDSMDDIPPETSSKSDTDFLAAFVETPMWAVKSRPFVAKLLYTDKIDLLPYLGSVCQLDEPCAEFFERRLSEQNPFVTNSKGEQYRTDLESGTEIVELPEGCISRSRLIATALDKVYGSRLDLLNPEILKHFRWEPKHSFDICRWHGFPKIAPPYGGPHSIDIYLCGRDVLYVGCGTVSRKDSGFEYTPWATPSQVISSESLVGPELEGRLELCSAWGCLGYKSVTAFGEVLKDTAKKNCVELFFKSMVNLLTVSGAKSGRKSVTDTYVYDIPNDKIYTFSSTDDSELGTYRGEMTRDEFYEVYKKHSACVKLGEDACASISEFTIKRAEPAVACFEAEYARTHKPFKLFSGYAHEVNTAGFIELLKRSGLVKRLTESSINDRMAYPVSRTLSNGVRLLYGQSPLGHTHMLGIWTDNKYIGFEAGFDMIKLAEKLDDRINGLESYPNSSRGYFDITEKDDIFPVTPRKNNADEIGLAIDFLSGKLVLVVYEGHDDCDTGILCSFDSAKDARDFFTTYGIRFLAPPPDYVSRMFVDVTWFTSKNDGSVAERILTVHPHMGSRRIRYSLIQIGGLSVPDDSKLNEDVYDMSILTYCRI